MNTPKILSEKTVHKAHFFDVNAVDLEFPDGTKKRYEQVIRGDAISIFPITENYEIYLVKQYRILHKKVTIEGCAGMMEPGEDPAETARRELEEETGLLAKEIKPLGVLHAAGSIVTWNQNLFYATGLTEGTTKFDDDEDIELIKLFLDEAVEKVFSGEINISSTVTGVLMLDIMRRKGEI